MAVCISTNSDLISGGTCVSHFFPMIPELLSISVHAGMYMLHDVANDCKAPYHCWISDILVRVKTLLDENFLWLMIGAEPLMTVGMVGR